MNINSSNTNFKAKFLDTPDLRDIVVDSVQKGKFQKLNQARKNIEKTDLRTRLKVNLCYTGDYPTVIFSKYTPRKDVPVALSFDDYELTGVTEYTSSKKENILKYARNLLIKMGNNAPKNKIYQTVVVTKDKNFKAPKYDIFG